MEDLNQVQWPKEVSQKIIDHIFGQPVSPEVAESMGLYEPANKLFTKVFAKEVQGFTDKQRAEQGLSTRQGEVPYDLVYTKDGYSAVPPGMSPHTSGQTNLESPTTGPGFALDYNEKGDVVAVPVQSSPTLSSASIPTQSAMPAQQTMTAAAPSRQPQERVLYERFKNAPSRPVMMEEDEEDLPRRKRTRKKKAKSKNKFSLRNLFGRRDKGSKGTKGTPRYL
jgi:hypothetical protein